jgi:hypothetical protein
MFFKKNTDNIESILKSIESKNIKEFESLISSIKDTNKTFKKSPNSNTNWCILWHILEHGNIEFLKVFMDYGGKLIQDKNAYLLLYQNNNRLESIEMLKYIFDVFDINSTVNADGNFIQKIINHIHDSETFYFLSSMIDLGFNINIEFEFDNHNGPISLPLTIQIVSNLDVYSNFDIQTLNKLIELGLIVPQKLNEDYNEYECINTMINEGVYNNNDTRINKIAKYFEEMNESVFYSYAFAIYLNSPQSYTNNPELDLNEKLEKIKSILEEYLHITSIGDWEISVDDIETLTDPNDPNKEIEVSKNTCRIQFKSPLSMWDHWDSDNIGKGTTSNSFPLYSNNMYVIFEESGGILANISKIVELPHKQSRFENCTTLSCSVRDKSGYLEFEFDADLYYDKFELHPA